MDLEIKVGCSKCTKEYFMGTETHRYVHTGRPTVGGLCPHCNNYNVVIMGREQIRVYNPTRVDITEMPYHAG